jgi:hypothetical protein
MHNSAVKAKAAQVKRISSGTKRLYAVVNGVVVFI